MRDITSQVLKKHVNSEINWKSLLMIINIKDEPTEFNSLILDKNDGFFLSSSTVNMILKTLTDEVHIEKETIRSLARCANIRQHIPYVLCSIQLIKMKPEAKNKNNTSWIANNNLLSALPIDSKKTELRFDGFPFPIVVDSPVTFIEKQIKKANDFKKIQFDFCQNVKEVIISNDSHNFGVIHSLTRFDLIHTFIREIRKHQSTKDFKLFFDREPTENELEDMLK